MLAFVDESELFAKFKAKLSRSLKCKLILYICGNKHQIAVLHIQRGLYLRQDFGRKEFRYRRFYFASFQFYPSQSAKPQRFCAFGEIVELLAAEICLALY